MDNKQFWALVAEKEKELYAGQRSRQALVAQGVKDPSPHQPISEPFAWAITEKLVDGLQAGGAVVPLAFALLAKNLVGQNGNKTHRLATEEEMAEFWKSQSQRKAEGEAKEDRLARRDRVVVTSVAPAPRERAA